MFNPAALLQFKKQWEDFSVRHPRFVQFLYTLINSNVGEGAIIDVKVTLPSGEVVQSNMKVTAEDVELIRNIGSMAGKQ